MHAHVCIRHWKLDPSDDELCLSLPACVSVVVASRILHTQTPVANSRDSTQGIKKKKNPIFSFLSFFSPLLGQTLLLRPVIRSEQSGVLTLYQSPQLTCLHYSCLFFSYQAQSELDRADLGYALVWLNARSAV